VYPTFGSYYAVAAGWNPGVYTTWCAFFPFLSCEPFGCQGLTIALCFARIRDECQRQTLGYSSNYFRKFNNLDDACRFVQGG
jgi:hypothetical protein